MSKKLECVVSGKTITVSDEYFMKKVEDFGSEERVSTHYVSRQVKNLLKRGYKVKEIRELLKVSRTNEVADSTIKEILNLKDEDSLNLDKVGVKTSDPEVTAFVNTLKND